FQAEDGIRDATVTGVQTCALPISHVGIEPYDAGGLRGRGAVRKQKGICGIGDQKPAKPPAIIPEQVENRQRAGSIVEESSSASKIGRASCRERERNSGGGCTTKQE